MKTLILANGELHVSQEIFEAAKTSELIIAADGGSRHCAPLDCSPHYLVGDLDSIPQELLESYKKEEINILQYPARKDATDLALSMDLALELGATEIRLAGLLGGRWDMSLSNVFLLAQDKYATTSISVHGEDCTMHILHPGKHTFTTKPETQASILPLHSAVEGVTLTGFEYPLQNFTIPFGSTIGLSNITKQSDIEINTKSGVLLLLFSSNFS